MKSKYAYPKTKKGFRKHIQKWMPMSLLNTYVDRMRRFKGGHRQDWRCWEMYKEIYCRLMILKGEIVREKE